MADWLARIGGGREEKGGGWEVGIGLDWYFLSSFPHSSRLICWGGSKVGLGWVGLPVTPRWRCMEETRLARSSLFGKEVSCLLCYGATAFVLWY